MIGTGDAITIGRLKLMFGIDISNLDEYEAAGNLIFRRESLEDALVIRDEALKHFGFEETPEDHWVYLCYQNESLLYIGITYVGIQRIKQHWRHSRFWPLVTRIEVLHFQSRRESEDEERRLIRTLRPPFNVTHSA